MVSVDTSEVEVDIEFYKLFPKSLYVLEEGMFHSRKVQMYSCAKKLLALGGAEAEEEDVAIYIAKFKKFLIGIEIGIGLAPGFQRSGCRPSPELLEMVKEAREKGVRVFAYTENKNMLKFEEGVLKEDIDTNEGVADATLLELTSEGWMVPSAQLLAELDGADQRAIMHRMVVGGYEDAADEDGDISSGDDDDADDEGEDEVAPNQHASQVRPPIPQRPPLIGFLHSCAIQGPGTTWSQMRSFSSRVTQRLQPLLAPLPR